MNNTVVFAAAGNGKTYTICKKVKELAANTHKDILIISYTNEGKNAIETEYKKQNFGVIDENVIIKTWYAFLLSDFIKPYQCNLKLKIKVNRNEFDFKVPENYINSIAFYEEQLTKNYFGLEHVRYFLNSSNDIHKDNVSALAHKSIVDSQGEVIVRMEEIYHSIFIDELQDYAGWDLELFKSLFASSINIYCVGDNKQATFRTNNSNKNKQYRDDKIIDFFKLLEKKGDCKVEYSNLTRRFNQEICDYINMIYDDQDNPVIQDLIAYEDADNIGVYIIDEKFMDLYCEYFNPTILRYNITTKIPFEHNSQVFNYGASKGCTFERVAIIPIRTIEPFITGMNKITSSQTRSKFYVACTRAKHSIVFVMKNATENDFFYPITIEANGRKIPAFKFKKI